VRVLTRASRKQRSRPSRPLRCLGVLRPAALTTLKAKNTGKIVIDASEFLKQ